MDLQPYTPGALPRHLAGREGEIRRIRRFLAPVVAYGEFAGAPTVFHAVRGLGKTSLLRHAQREAEALGFVTAWVACAKAAPYLPDLEAAVREGLARTALAGSPASRSTGRRTLGAEVGLPGLKVTAQVESSAADQEAPEASVAAVGRHLHEAAARIRASGGAGLVLFVDEWHAGRESDTSVLLNAVQALGGRPEENPLAVVGAGLPSVVGTLTRAATFAERTAWVRLRELDPDPSRELVLEPAAQLGVGWDSAALDLVALQAGGHPYFLQLIAAHAWEAADPARGDTITVDHVEHGLVGVSDQVTEMYEARWQAASPAERRFIVAMASTGEPVVARGEIARILEMASEKLGVPRDRLIDKGIVEEAGRGRLRFTLPGFGRHVVERADEGTGDCPAVPGVPAPPELGP
ncbi:ATP-binding protein [Aeromicrobium sp. Sec7.5]|uniref:ATP-binding protein n=1 Tax=Aeromicrobium sp. Sec7.5 TaxID=3121276 RepID=UPI002FE4E335